MIGGCKRVRHPDRRGVAFRALAFTRVDSSDRCRYGARIEATPRGDGAFNTLVIKQLSVEPRLQGAAAAHSFRRHTR
jgi:hypothetical protein